MNSCYLNPKNISLCPICKQPIKYNVNTYCSSRCAALDLTPGRKHSIETRRKISKSLGGNGVSTSEIKCKTCDDLTINSRIYCDKCLTKYKIKQGHKNIKCSGLVFTHYENDLEQILNKKYGILKKECINGIYPDFCNEKYIIDFTFDNTKGTSDLILRFKKINDSRIKIAYIHDKHVGINRRQKLLDMNIVIKSSDKYRFLLNKNSLFL